VNVRTLVPTLLVVAAAGCGGSTEEPQVEPAARQIEAGARAVQQDAEQAAARPQHANPAPQGPVQAAHGFEQLVHVQAQPIEFEQLKALLPEIGGWTRSDERGEDLTLPVSYSRAEAVYRRDDSRIELEITDTALSQMLLAPLSMFLASGYSERSDEGFRRAVKIGSHPGMEKWNSDGRHGEVTAIVGSRYIVRASGDDVSDLAFVRRVVEEVDLTKLAALK
jgi:hypothetical protein